MPDLENTAEVLDDSLIALKNLTTNYVRAGNTADQVAGILFRIRQEAKVAIKMIDEVLNDKVQEFVVDKPATFNID